MATKVFDNLDFADIIGGPLDAAVTAQAYAAESTIKMIQSIGLDGDNQIRNVSFKYNKEIDGNVEQFQLDVPFLTIIPIPFLQIDEVTIEFNAEVRHFEYDISGSSSASTSTNTNSNFSSKSSGFDGRLGGKALFKKVSLFGSIGGQKNKSSSSTSTSVSTSRSNSYDRSYSSDQEKYHLHVIVKASQAGLPRGADRILDILESVITENNIRESVGIEISGITSNVVTTTQNHGLSDGQVVQLRYTTLDNNENTNFYVKKESDTTFTLYKEIEFTTQVTLTNTSGGGAVFIV